MHIEKRAGEKPQTQEETGLRYGLLHLWRARFSVEDEGIKLERRQA